MDDEDGYGLVCAKTLKRVSSLISFGGCCYSFPPLLYPPFPTTVMLPAWIRRHVLVIKLLLFNSSSVANTLENRDCFQETAICAPPTRAVKVEVNILGNCNVIISRRRGRGRFLVYSYYYYRQNWFVVVIVVAVLPSRGKGAQLLLQSFLSGTILKIHKGRNWQSVIYRVTEFARDLSGTNIYQELTLFSHLNTKISNNYVHEALLTLVWNLKRGILVFKNMI